MEPSQHSLRAEVALSEDPARPGPHISPTGIRCHACGCTHWETTHVRHLTNGTIRRRRVCRHCRAAVMTDERAAK